MKVIRIIAATVNEIGKLSFFTFLFLIAVIILQMDRCSSDTQLKKMALSTEEQRVTDILKIDSITTKIIENQKVMLANQDSIINRQSIIMFLNRR